MELIQNLDHTILLWITQNMRQAWLDPIVMFITSLGNMGAIWIMIACVLLIRPRTRRCGIAMLIALVIGVVVGNVVIKNIVARTRPFALYQDIIPLVIPADPYAFPSGHTLSSFCAATVCFLFYQKAGIFCYALATLIGFSRLYVGVHYLSDVLFGALFGIIIGVLAVWFVNTCADVIRFRRIRR